MVESETTHPDAVGPSDAEDDGPLGQSRGERGEWPHVAPSLCLQLTRLRAQGAESVSIRELLGQAALTSSARDAKGSNQHVTQGEVRTLKKVRQRTRG